MDLWPLVAAGFLLVFTAVVLPRWRGRYEEPYEDDRAFFREQRPRMWGLVGGVAGGGEAGEADRGRDSGRCPVCGTETDPTYTFCGNCDSRLPERDE